MKATIDNKDKLINQSHSEKLISALNRIQKAHNEITKMGYSVYIESEGNYHALNGESHSGINQHAQYDNVVASVRLNGIDMGGW